MQRTQRRTAPGPHDIEPSIEILRDFVGCVMAAIITLLGCRAAQAEAAQQTSAEVVSAPPQGLLQIYRETKCVGGNKGAITMPCTGPLQHQHAEIWKTKLPLLSVWPSIL